MEHSLTRFACKEKALENDARKITNIFILETSTERSKKFKQSLEAWEGEFEWSIRIWLKHKMKSRDKQQFSNQISLNIMETIFL